MLLVLIHSWLRKIQHTNLKALKENWQPNFQEGSIFWQDRLFGGHPATKGSNTSSPPCLNETMNCHACLRYPMRIIPSYYWKEQQKSWLCVMCGEWLGTLTTLANIILISIGSDEPIFATCCLQVTILHAVLIQDVLRTGGFKEFDLTQ